jgi:hypothetical protein
MTKYIEAEKRLRSLILKVRYFVVTYITGEVLYDEVY